MFVFDPFLFPQCHASTLTRLPDGRTLIAWFAGSSEGQPDISIHGSFFDKGNFTKPSLIAKVSNVAHWNPVLFTTPQNDVLLYFKVGEKIAQWETWVTKLAGDKWEKPHVLVKTLLSKIKARGPVRSRPIVLSNGWWLAPSSVENTIGFYHVPYDINKPYNLPFRPLVVWKAFVDISKNNGKTWRKTELIDFDRKKYGQQGKYGGVIQPTLWESSNGNVHMLLRSTAGKIFKSDSKDYGETWSEAYETHMPNNNSGIDVVKYDDILFLVYNPISGNWASRGVLAMAFSLDNGVSWFRDITLEHDDSGSFSYPSIIPLTNGIALTYTWNRKSIKYREFEISKEKDQMKIDEKKYENKSRNL